jgi:DNA-binding transcriptional LysR family regulator
MRSQRRQKANVRHDTAAFSGLEVRHLRAFVALVEEERVTAAARTLGLAQSTVSESLAALERAAGAPLILRRRGVHALALTDAGRALLPHARTILSAVDAAQSAMAATTFQAPARVNIIANESVSTYLLPGVLPPLRRRWPRTRFAVSVAACAGVLEGVADGAFDLGLLLESNETRRSRRETADAGRFLERRVVLPAVPLVLFAAPSHALARAGPAAIVRRDALSAYPLFVSDAAGDFHNLVRRFFRRDRTDGPVIESAGTVEGVKKAVAADARAIGLLPLYAVAENLRAGTFARMNLRPAPPEMRLDALLSKSRGRHPSADALLEGLSSKPVEPLAAVTARTLTRL